MMESSLASERGIPFIREVSRELQRAERYSIFVSLTVIDLSFVEKHNPEVAKKLLQEMCDIIQSHLRTIDYVSPLGDKKLGLLFPETSRQGAEIVIKRIAELVKEHIEKTVDSRIEDIIPIEVASYPDASGARSVKEFLKDWGEKHKN